MTGFALQACEEKEEEEIERKRVWCGCLGDEKRTESE